MTDKNLRTKLIRLAHANPHLRADLLPLLGKKAGLDAKRKLTCEGEMGCKNPVTRVGEKWIYCDRHAYRADQMGRGLTRKLLPAEIKILEAGGTIRY